MEVNVTKNEVSKDSGCCFMALLYPVRVKKIKDDYGEFYYGTIDTLEQCNGLGGTMEEMEESLRSCLQEYLEEMRDIDSSIPLPMRIKGVDGKNLDG